jgi:hypothetical protein
MIKSLTIAISLLSMGLSVSYWEGIVGNVASKLRGTDDSVSIKSDETAQESTGLISSLRADSSRDVVDADSIRLNEYNLSPYERHFPMYRLDPWMRKTVDRIPLKENEVCLVHVGKVRSLVDTLLT